MRFAPILLLAACGRCGFGGSDHPDALPMCTPQTIVERIELGASFACAQLPDKTLMCWGDGSEGQLGTGDLAGSEVPVAPIGLGPVDDFALGVAHACAIAAGNVYCWGRNHTGQIGNNSALVAPQPVRINTPPNIVAIATGGMNTCAIRDNGELWCWGQEHGTAAGTSRIPTRVTVPPVQTVALSTGDALFSAAHGCAVTTDGNVWCFGANAQFQLGVTTPTASDPPLQSMFSGADAIVAGDYYTCARTPAREVYCWGFGEAGRLGDDTPTMRADARRVEITDVEELAAHDGAICARTTSGDVYCWGSNNHHEIPGYAGMYATTPVKLPFLDATSLAVGSRTGCVVENQIVYCWGDERIDRPGHIHTTAVGVKVLGFVLNGIDDLEASGDRTCAHRSDNALACWGAGSLGQHGDGTRNDRSEAGDPMRDVRTFGLGHHHTCRVRGNGTVDCWGADGAAQVGGTAMPTFEPTLTPKTVNGIGEPVVEIISGAAHTCARATSNRLWCWGNNAEGQLVGGTDPAAVTLSMFAPSLRVAAGGNHTCVVDAASSAVLCAGRNNENQIDAMINDAPVPRQAVASATTVSSQKNFNCALAGTDALCWGDNTYGQLADGTYTNRAAPMAAMTSVIDVVAGSRHACARTAAGQTWCWGANDAGQLGDGTLISRTAPVRATALDGVTQLALGDRHTCGLEPGGTVRCIGSDRRGQLGDGGALAGFVPTPAAISCP